jgi:Tol biopolymer transport system component
MNKVKVSKSFLGVLVLAISLGVILGASVQQSAEEMYEAAVFKKDADGDMQGAIKIFREIVERYPHNVEIAAKAQLQIGICYEKMGQKTIEQAQEAFQKVLDNYPGQTDAVKLAKAKLSLIMQVKSAIPEAELGLKTQKISSDPMVDSYAAISPDGRYVSFVDWRTGDLAVYDTQDGNRHRLTDKGSWKESFEMALRTRWSPDGRKIAYAWIGKDSRDLRIVSMNDPNSRILVRSPYADKKTYKETDCHDWSPDGKQILALVSKDNLKQIVAISVEDGSIQTIKTLHKAEPINLRYSPDGRSIAYDYPAREGFPERDIFLLSVDGKKVKKLVEHPADDFFLGFLPDGKHFLFASDRSGAKDVWIAPLGEGSNLRKPELVKSNIGNIAPLGITQKGALCYIHLRSFFNVFSAEIDPEKGELLTPPKKLVKYHEGMNTWPDYSPDGKHIAFLSRRNIREVQRTPRARGSFLCVFSLENGELKEIPSKLNMFSPPRWSPDGKSILINGAYDDDSVGLYTIDVQTGETLPVVLDDAVQNSYEWSVDGKSIFYVRFIKKEKFSAVLSIHLESGQTKQLFHLNDGVNLSISCSPDGKWLAVLDSSGRRQRELRILPAAGGEPRKLHTFEQTTGHGIYPDWSPDGKFILYPNNQPSREDESDRNKGEINFIPWFLFCIPVDGGEPRAINFGVHLLFNPRIHPDGKNVAFGTFGKIEDNITAMKATGIWMMENFLPKKK